MLALSVVGSFLSFYLAWGFLQIHHGIKHSTSVTFAQASEAFLFFFVGLLFVLQFDSSRESPVAAVSMGAFLGLVSFWVKRGDSRVLRIKPEAIRIYDKENNRVL